MGNCFGFPVNSLCPTTARPSSPGLTDPPVSHGIKWVYLKVTYPFPPFFFLLLLPSVITIGPSTSKTTSSTITTGKLSSISSNTFGQSTGSSVSVYEAFPEGRILEAPNLRIFTFAELKNATRNFKPETVLGEGGFGRVYKGWVDEKTLNPAKSGVGMVIAVKKLNPESMQGLEEWQVIVPICLF